MTSGFAEVSPLTVVKPGLGRRSFGVVLVPTDRFPEVAPELGLVAPVPRLARAAELTVIGLLWGQGAELLALAQPYIRSRSRRHPRTGRHHTAIARATVVMSDGQPRCVDVRAVLAASPHDTAVGRDALVITGTDEPAILAVHDDEAETIRQAAELFVTRMEDAVRLRFPRPDPVDMLRTEVELLVHMLDTTSDGPVAEAWDAHHETITGYEALMQSDYCDRDSTS